MVPLAFTLFHAMFLSDRSKFHRAELAQLRSLVGAMVEQSATMRAPKLPLDGAIVSLAKKAFQWAWTVAEATKQSAVHKARVFCPFGCYYSVEVDGRGMHAIEHAGEMSDLLYPHSIRELAVEHALRHSVRSYTVDVLANTASCGTEAT